jgi:uroporphyrinogen-III synthase
MTEIDETANPRGLAGARVGLFEGRMGSELSSLVRRHGGVPRLAPALREATVDATDAVVELLDALAEGRVQIVVFLTGVGASALFAAAERIGRLDELTAALHATTNLCRGQKPWMPLKRNGVPISVTVPAPYTTADVVSTLATLHPGGRGVALLHYGERSEVLTEALAGWGARVVELFLYGWQLPEDTGPLGEIIEEIIRGEVDAVAFTTQVQVRHLLRIAGAQGREAALIAALNTRSVVAAVGPTCAAALEAAGVVPDVVPTNPKMGPMVLALAAHLSAARAAGSAA